MAVIIEVAYGHQIKKDDDPYLTIANEVCHIVTPAVSPPENSLVNLFPFLVKAARPIIQWLYEYPFFDVKKKLIYKVLQQSSMLPVQKQQVTLEMTSSTLQIFLLALFLYPEFQKRAQEEMDLVVGDECLPELSDHPLLPLLESLIQESQRWCPTVPLGVPHYSMEDDVYEGMFIPKKLIIIANARGMALDKNIYADPFTFDPTCFLPQPLGRGELYPSSNFGFGRRVCPGRHFAEESVWLAVAMMLATLTVSKAIGDDGKEIEPSGSFMLSVTKFDYPFEQKFSVLTFFPK
ncbi:cytochrome P450 [Tricholoma matsutake]|nr:cytochrome P450 [Tricholoma matsutake 945]